MYVELTSLFLTNLTEKMFKKVSVIRNETNGWFSEPRLFKEHALKIQLFDR